MSTTPPAKVRVRFAPSPTGHLHVGGARTAIFNWLFARRHRGTFVLRIEDTDVERSTAESEASLIEDLRWLGLDWDEGPVAGGEYGPYRQSERLDLYRGCAENLVAAGAAYPCFCSDADLRAKKERAIAAGRPPQYDGTCRGIGADEVAAKRRAGAAEVVRFRVPAGVVRFHDLVRGDIEIDTRTVGDFVLVRSNGRPTYNFAAAVDDHSMKITHVLRGEEHLPNTLRQVLVYRALGADLPRFAHLPLILAEDRSKLSKRHGASSVGELRAMGYLPGAVVNYLALLGWSHPGGKEVLDARELVDGFTLERINKSAAVFDRKKLSWMSGQHIRMKTVDEIFETADAHFPQFIHARYDEGRRREMLRLLQDGIDSFSALAEASAIFRSPPEYDDEAAAVLASPEAAAVLGALADALGGTDEELTADGFKAMMKAVGRRTGVKGKALFFPVRAALTGTVHGPDLGGVAALEGRGEVIARVRRAREPGASG